MASNNPNVLKGRAQLTLTPEQKEEFKKCQKDPLYFIQNYIYVKHPVSGLTQFRLYKYQKQLIKAYHSNKEVIVLYPRQSGKSETTCAYLFWVAIFNEDKTILITSNKSKNAKDMIRRIKYMYENLVEFLKPGVTDDGWNALSLKFETGSRIDSDATSETTGRGGTFSILFSDEMGFVRPSIQTEFWGSISPTLATGGKLFITSTPNGDSDLFSTLWRGALSGSNGMIPLSIKWNDVPGRDETFKAREIAKNGVLKWEQEYECFKGTEHVIIKDVDGWESAATGEQLCEMLCDHVEQHSDGRVLHYNSTNLRILTPHGFENFGGIAFNGVKRTITIKFSDGTSLAVTPSHILFKRGEEVFAKDIKLDDVVDGSPVNKTVVSVTPSQFERVFDIIHTESHTYLVNGVTSHNCRFVSSDPLLIDSLKAQLLVSSEPVSVDQKIAVWKSFEGDINTLQPVQQVIPRHDNRNFDNWYSTGKYNEYGDVGKPRYSKQCICTIDPSKGVGNDFTVIQIFSYPGLEQMMEYRSNEARTGEVYKILRYIWNKAKQAGWEVMFTVENNGPGEGIVTLFENDDKLPDNVEIISDGGKQIGMNTNNSSKLRACRIFKEFVESGKLIFHSPEVIREIKTYIQTKGSYAAQVGSTDDCVSAVLLVCRIVHQIAAYDEEAYAKLYEVSEMMEESNDDGFANNEDDYDDMPIVF